MTVGAMTETYVRSSLQKGFPGPDRRTGTKPRLHARVTRSYSGRGLCVGMRRDRQQAQVQRNCSLSNRTRQCCTKISVLPCCASMMQHLSFSKGYKILNGPEGHWYYSCYVVDGIAMRGLPLGHALRIPEMFACARLQ